MRAKTFKLKDGPFKGQSVKLSGYALERTLSFSCRGETGFYVRVYGEDRLTWVEEK